MNNRIIVLNSPVNFIDPDGRFSFFHHGNWGGPGWAAGGWNSEAGLTKQDFQVPAIDARDACYKGHDKCIWKATQKGGSCGNTVSDQIESCDYALASCLKKISPFDPSFWVTIKGSEIDKLIPVTMEAEIVFEFLAPWYH